MVVQIDSVEEAAPGLDCLFSGDEKWVLHRFSVALGPGLGPHSKGSSSAVSRGLLQAGGRQSWTS